MREIERRLRELVDRGDLAGLPGEGRPFAPDDLAGDDSSWAAFRLMKNNQVIPTWSGVRIEIDQEIERIRARCVGHRAWLEARAVQLRSVPADRMLETLRITEREDRRARAAITTAVDELNVRIATYNTMVPSAGLALMPVSAAALLASVP